MKETFFLRFNWFVLLPLLYVFTYQNNTGNVQIEQHGF